MSRSNHIKNVGYVNYEEEIIESVYKWMDSKLSSTKKKNGLTKKCYLKNK